MSNYYRDEPNNPPLNNDNPPTVNYNVDPKTSSASFKYKRSITGKTPNVNQKKVKTLSKIIQMLKNS